MTPRSTAVRRTTAATTLALGLLAGCGDDASTSSVDDENPWNEADVAFAADMIPHHAQALVMVDMTRGRNLDPGLAALTDQILATQAPEIELMADWLTSWEEPVPETMRDHANAHGDGGHPDGTDHRDMPGMMSDEELDGLESAAGESFEEMWLDMMIEHHEGAIEMAGTEIAEGEFPEAIELAEQIRDGQQAEIEQMEQLLAS
ncbi:DUF305 domain-containing protein [Nocardioides sp. GCM10027113]|uniref:DUF305 domain-containing protein n=1 Tax=unclassified Nocardioides TaxID=2615069 RepID=UPI00360BA26F